MKVSSDKTEHARNQGWMFDLKTEDGNIIFVKFYAETAKCISWLKCVITEVYMTADISPLDVS